MPDLPTDRDTADTAADHVTDHNTLHGLNNELSNFVQSASAPGSPAEGDLWLDTDEVSPSGTWATWTPTLTNLTLGNGTVVAKYTQFGKTVHYYFRFILGSTSAVGTNPSFTLPVTPANTTANIDVPAVVQYLDFGTAQHGGWVVYVSGAMSFKSAISPMAGLTNAVPFTWATSDVLVVSGTYEAA